MDIERPLPAFRVGVSESPGTQRSARDNVARNSDLQNVASKVHLDDFSQGNCFPVHSEVQVNIAATCFGGWAFAWPRISCLPFRRSIALTAKRHQAGQRHQRRTEGAPGVHVT